VAKVQKKAKDQAAAAKKITEHATAAQRKAEEEVEHAAAAQRKAEEEALSAKMEAKRKMAAAEKEMAAAKKAEDEAEAAKMTAGVEVAAARKAEEEAFVAKKRAEDEAAAAKRMTEEAAVAKKMAEDEAAVGAHFFVMAEEAAAVQKQAGDEAASAKKEAEEEIAAAKKAENEAAVAKVTSEKEVVAAKRMAEEAVAAQRKAEDEAAAARRMAEEAVAAQRKAEDEAAAARRMAEDAVAANIKAEDEAAAEAKKSAEKAAATIARNEEEAATARVKGMKEAAAAKKMAEEEVASAKKEAEEEIAAVKKLREEAIAAKKRAEEEMVAAKRMAEEAVAAQRKAEDEAAAARRMAEEAAAAKKMAEDEAKKRGEDEERKKAEEEAQRKAEEQAKEYAEEQAKEKAEEEERRTSAAQLAKERAQDALRTETASKSKEKPSLWDTEDDCDDFLLQAVDHVYEQILATNGDVRKDELVAAQYGDVKQFSDLVVDSSGRVSVEKWNEFCSEARKKKKEKGWAHVRCLMHSVKRNMFGLHHADRKPTINWNWLLKEARDAFKLLATHEDPARSYVMKTELEDAQEGDIPVNFLKDLKINYKGEVKLKDWLAFCEVAAAHPEGETWLQILVHSISVRQCASDRDSLPDIVANFGHKAEPTVSASPPPPPLTPPPPLSGETSFSINLSTFTVPPKAPVLSPDQMANALKFSNTTIEGEEDLLYVVSDERAQSLAFAKFDADHDGQISIKEATDYLLSRPPEERPPGFQDINPFQKEKIRRQLAAIDQNGDDDISFGEFELWWNETAHSEDTAKHMAERSASQLAFESFDIDNDGTITIDEVITYLDSVSPEERPEGLQELTSFHKEKIRKRLEAMDSDNDGNLSYSEFQSWWSATHRLSRQF